MWKIDNLRFNLPSIDTKENGIIGRRDFFAEVRHRFFRYIGAQSLESDPILTLGRSSLLVIPRSFYKAMRQYITGPIL
jgi:hypothetical protein